VRGVALFGVRRQNWPSVRRDFAPLGQRFEAHGPRDMEANSLLARTEQVPPSKPFATASSR
jgi:hypothetical protein